MPFIVKCEISTQNIRSKKTWIEYTLTKDKMVQMNVQSGLENFLMVEKGMFMSFSIFSCREFTKLACWVGKWDELAKLIVGREKLHIY